MEVFLLLIYLQVCPELKKKKLFAFTVRCYIAVCFCSKIDFNSLV